MEENYKTFENLKHSIDTCKKKTHLKIYFYKNSIYSICNYYNNYISFFISYKNKLS